MNKSSQRKIRYAVVGLGYFGQSAVLPAFKHATDHSELAALVSDDTRKLAQLGKKYKVKGLCKGYANFETCLRSEKIDAVYIALPNHLHREFTERAAGVGVHVLCEKPMAVTADECRSMIDVCRQNGVKLMIAYRLHFEEANLSAMKIAQSGRLGEVKIFQSVFSMEVRPDDIRARLETGGGTLYDIGIYCINAARYIFRSQPLEVMALTANSPDSKIHEVDEMAGAVMRFPRDRLAVFTTSFDAAKRSYYEIIGTKGTLKLDPAYDYARALKHELTIGEKTSKTRFKKRDQVAPEIDYFSECILKNRHPEPSGEEGLIDVRIIEALYQSAASGTAVPLAIGEHDPFPRLSQEKRYPGIKKPKLVNETSPHPK